MVIRKAYASILTALTLFLLSGCNNTSSDLNISGTTLTEINKSIVKTQEEINDIVQKKHFSNAVEIIKNNSSSDDELTNKLNNQTVEEILTHYYFEMKQLAITEQESAQKKIQKTEINYVNQRVIRAKLYSLRVENTKINWTNKTVTLNFTNTLSDSIKEIHWDVRIYNSKTNLPWFINKTMSEMDNSIKPGEQRQITLSFHSNSDINSALLNEIRSNTFVKATPINLKKYKSKLLKTDLISENDIKNMQSIKKYWQVTGDMYSKMLGELKG